MFRTIGIDETFAATSETLFAAITAKVGVKTRIVEVWFEQTAAYVLRGYVEQDRLVDVPSEVAQADFKAVPVDRVLADGETFRVGFLNTTTEGTKHIAVVIEESPA